MEELVNIETFLKERTCYAIFSFNDLKMNIIESNIESPESKLPYIREVVQEGQLIISNRLKNRIFNGKKDLYFFVNIEDKGVVFGVKFWDAYFAHSVREIIDGLKFYISHIKLGNRDPLSGLYNRVEMYGYKNKGTLLLLDIDNFKMINDTEGHAVGDRLIVYFSQNLKRSFKSEKIFRYGGDEFVVLTEKSYFEIIHAINGLNIKLKEFNKGLSVSFGISVDPNIHKAIDIADKAMYLHKQRK